MVDNGGANRGTESIHHVDNSVRETSFLRQRSHVECGEWGLFCGFKNQSATHGQRRSPLPGQHQHRVIPGNDLTNHADWFLPDVRHHWTVRRDRTAVDLISPASIISERIDGTIHVEYGISERLSVVQRFQIGQHVDVTLHQIGQLVQQLAATGRVHLTPRRASGKGRLGRLNGCLNVHLVTLSHIDDLLAGSGVDRCKRFAALRVDELVVDKELRN